MSGIYIRGMEMPTDCIFCPLFHGEWQMCSLTERGTQLKGRAKDCPLIPVPDHGELIERKRLNDVCYTHFADFMEGKIDGKTALLNIEKEIKAAPTIPTADVAPVRRGRWDVYSAKDCLYTCSECHCLPSDRTQFCPSCGARMDLEDENG